MIQKNQTWEFVDKPSHKKVICIKWVFKTKLIVDSSLNRLKARLIVKGFSQQYDSDYWETFAPVVKLDTILLLLALAAQAGWKIHLLDVKSTFLNGYLQEEIYVVQPLGFVVRGKEEKVYRLKKPYMD